MEDLLNKEEIKSIIRDSKKEEFSNDAVVHMGNNKTSIILHSHKSGLILVRGNKDTGYEHIFDRHSLLSRNPFWDKNGKIGKPTKFRMETAPIEYLTIAEQIFKKENLNTEKNTSPDKFDLYIGDFNHFDSKKVEYKLITYKSTGIIHTFFVSSNKKPFNPKKIIDLRKGWVKATHFPSSGIQLFNFSYFDVNDTEVVKVFVECSSVKKKEEWAIELYNDKGSLVSKKIIKVLDYIETGIHDKMEQLDFGDISWLEKEIKQVLIK